MTEAEKALKAIESACLSGHDYTNPIVPHLETIRIALQKSAQVDNEMRIKVLKEMGFEYLPVTDGDGVLVSHAIVHPTDKGFFVNHTNLMCAMQRIRIAIDVLARAKMKAQVDGLVKALEDGYELSRYAAASKRVNTDEFLFNGGLFARISAFQAQAEKILQQFNAKEG